MKRIDPAFPDLLPLTHRLGRFPASREGSRLDPVEMRLLLGEPPDQAPVRKLAAPRRPTRVMAHAAVVREQRELVEELLGAGHGLLLVLDQELLPSEIPAPMLDGQVAVVAPWWPAFWGGRGLVAMLEWQRDGFPCGILVAFAPSIGGGAEVQEAVVAAASAGATFVVVGPLAVAPEVRHQVYDRFAGDGGDTELENLLFHSDWGRLTLATEMAVSRTCREIRLAEGLQGPATAAADAVTFGVASGMLLWARRLDLLDGVTSQGWQLRRAAHALLASGRGAFALMAEDNLRVIPGFTPWVEAFSRALLHGAGMPLDEVRGRWLCG